MLFDIVFACPPGLAQALFSNYVTVLFIKVGRWRTTQINRTRGHHREMVRCKMGRSFGIKVGIARGEATLRQFPQTKLLIFLVFLGTMPLGKCTDITVVM